MTKYAHPDQTQGEIAEVWRACGWAVLDLHNAATSFRFEWRGVTHAGGLPDLLCTLGPCHVWVECKTPEGGLEAVQVAFAEMVRENGEWWTIERDRETATQEAQFYRDWALVMMRTLRRETR